MSPISCTFAGCNFKTSRREYLRSHVKNRHQCPQFKCEFCDKLLTTKIGWKIHLKTHTGELLPCTVCDFKTRYVYRLKTHIEKHELGNKGIDWPKRPNSHKCQLCDYLAPSEARVIMHARIHFDDMPYKCSIPGCGHRTKWKGNLKQHEDRHDPIKRTIFKCPMCPKRFCTDYQVTRHVQTHTQERPRECPDCDYKAATLVQVKRHQKRHHFSEQRHFPSEVKEDHVDNQRKHRRLDKLPLEKTLQCPLCPKKYASKLGLHTHVLCHTGEKAFKCELCDYKGITAQSVRHHFKRMHAH